MKKGLVLLLSASMLLGWPAPADAIPYISHDQGIHFSANHAYYWALIWDYTNGARESATAGYVNVDCELGYVQSVYGEVHVAYLYNYATGTYIEAQALRNVFL